MGAISTNGRSNMSCSTNAIRSAGVSVSRTTSRARPTESAGSILCFRVVPVLAAHDRLGNVGSERLLGPRLTRTQHVEAHPRDGRRQPALEVLHSARVKAAEPDRSRLPARRLPPRSASRACGRPPSADGAGSLQTVPPGSRVRSQPHPTTLRPKSPGSDCANREQACPEEVPDAVTARQETAACSHFIALQIRRISASFQYNCPKRVSRTRPAFIAAK